MKFRKIMTIVVSCLVALSILLAVLTFSVPAIKIRLSGSSSAAESTLYFYQFSGTLTGSSLSLDSFPVFFASLFFILGPILFAVAGKSKTLKYVGYGMTFTAIAFAFYLFSILTTALSANSGYLVTSNAGLVLIMAYAIIVIIAILLSLFDDLFGEKLETMISESGLNTEKRLLELNNLLQKNLITKEEYDERRKETLNAK